MLLLLHTGNSSPPNCSLSPVDSICVDKCYITLSVTTCMSPITWQSTTYYTYVIRFDLHTGPSPFPLIATEWLLWEPGLTGVVGFCGCSVLQQNTPLIWQMPISHLEMVANVNWQIKRQYLISVILQPGRTHAIVMSLEYRRYELCMKY